VSEYDVEVDAMDAGVQLVKVSVKVLVAEKAGAPSKVVAVLAGEVVLLPDPEQVPEIVKDLDMPFATTDR
jgi:hypothetical protein